NGLSCSWHLSRLLYLLLIERCDATAENCIRCCKAWHSSSICSLSLARSLVLTLASFFVILVSFATSIIECLYISQSSRHVIVSTYCMMTPTTILVSHATITIRLLSMAPVCYNVHIID